MEVTVIGQNIYCDLPSVMELKAKSILTSYVSLKDKWGKCQLHWFCRCRLTRSIAVAPPIDWFGRSFPSTVIKHTVNFGDDWPKHAWDTVWADWFKSMVWVWLLAVLFRKSKIFLISTYKDCLVIWMISDLCRFGENPSTCSKIPVFGLIWNMKKKQICRTMLYTIMLFDLA